MQSHLLKSHRGDGAAQVALLGLLLKHTWSRIRGQGTVDDTETLTSVREDDGKEGRRSSTLPMSFRRVRPTFWEREGWVAVTLCLFLLKSLLTLLQHYFCFMFWFFWSQGMWES